MVGVPGVSRYRPLQGLLGAFLAISMAGCGASALTRAREWVGLTALAGEQVDLELSEEYREAAEQALDDADNYVEYKEIMFPWDIAVSSMEGLREALQGAWLAIAAVESGHDIDYTRAMACLSGALGRLVASLSAVGVTFPVELEYAVVLGEPYLEGLCVD